MSETRDITSPVLIAKPSGHRPVALNLVDRVAGAVSVATSVVSTLAVLWLIAVTVAHVVLRWVGHSGISGVVELSALVVVAMIFLGMPMAQREGAHVSVQMVTQRLPQHVRRVLGVIAALVSAVFAGWICWASYEEAVKAQEVGQRLAGVVQVEVWPAKAAITIGLFGLVLETVNTLLKAVTDSGPPSDDAGTASTIEEI